MGSGARIEDSVLHESLDSAILEAVELSILFVDRAVRLCILNREFRNRISVILDWTGHTVPFKCLADIMD